MNALFFVFRSNIVIGFKPKVMVTRNEYFMCEWCPGETPTAEAVPHAVYSNAQGRSVIQENSVALGGFNGLNS